MNAHTFTHHTHVTPSHDITQLGVGRVGVKREGREHRKRPSVVVFVVNESFLAWRGERTERCRVSGLWGSRPACLLALPAHPVCLSVYTEESRHSLIDLIQYWMNV